METLRDRIKMHEGLRLKPYRDSLGNWTVGYGHKMDTVSQSIKEKGLSEEEVDHLFELDFEMAERGFDRLPDKVRRGCNEARKGVLTEMIFQLGYYGVLKFKKMLGALEQEDFNEAANQMIDSLWYKQTPRRCRRLAEIMRDGDAQ